MISIRVKKVHAFRKIVLLLFQLNVISTKEYWEMRRRANNISTTRPEDRLFYE